MREKRERKWGLTGSWRLYPIFALPTTNNLSYHPTLVLAQKSRPSSTVPEHVPVIGESEKRRDRERVREKRERKWGLTGSCGLYPIFALPTTNNRSYHPTLVLAQKSRPSSVVPERGPVLGESEKRR
ncbi:MAG: hypothetical protein ABRQ36_11195, partial [Mesotoga sp.]